MRTRLLTPILYLLVALSASAQIPRVWFTNAIDTTINIKPVKTPVGFAGSIYNLPPRGTNITTTNGITSLRLVPNDYIISFAGIPESWTIHVTNSAVADLSALDLTTNLVRYSGVQSITAEGATVVPPTGGGGEWHLIFTGGGGGSATNVNFFPTPYAFWRTTNGGSNVVDIVGVQPTNASLTAFANLGTNAFDTANSARNATNDLKSILVGGVTAGSNISAASSSSLPNGAINMRIDGINNTQFKAMFDANLGNSLMLSADFQDFTNSLGVAAFGDASGLSIGLVASARLGTGGDGSGTHYLADDHTFKSVSGSGDMLKSDNLSGLANTAAARSNLGAETAGAAATVQSYATAVSNLTYAASNAVNIASGKASEVSTNRFAPTNAPTVFSATVLKNFSATNIIGYVNGAGVDTLSLSVSNGNMNFTASDAGAGGNVNVQANDHISLIDGVSSHVIMDGSGNVNVRADTNDVGEGDITLDAPNFGVILSQGTVLHGDAHGATNLNPATAFPTPLIVGTGLKALQYTSTDTSTGLVSTLDGSSWTNLDKHFTNYGAVTNIVLPADGNSWRVLATNGPHNFFSFGGNNMGAMSIWVTTNGDAQWPAQVTFLGYSNHLTTNCIIDLQPWGGTNRVLGGQSEL